MQTRLDNEVGIRDRRRRPSAALSRSFTLACVSCILYGCTVRAQDIPSPNNRADRPGQKIRCLPSGDGYLKARLSGNLIAELDWGNEGTDCTGAVRPTDGGVRMRFSRDDPATASRLVIVFGIANLAEGASAKALPVNVTVIREGTGEFYSTQGDDKCTLDSVEQRAIVGIPYRSRAYRVVARGFCTEPARAVRGKGSVLLSRFDYAGRIDFDSEDTEDEDPVMAGKQ